MFPSPQDTEEFKTEFGIESTVHRMEIRRLGCYGTQAAAVIRPSSSKEETLKLAWSLVRAMAFWILNRSSDMPTSERYIVIVGWSQSVRKLQGQIFKTGGNREKLRIVADSQDWKQQEHALLYRWEKDVFDNPPA
jgi:hypothetical protein